MFLIGLVSDEEDLRLAGGCSLLGTFVVLFNALERRSIGDGIHEKEEVGALDGDARNTLHFGLASGVDKDELVPLLVEQNEFVEQILRRGNIHGVKSIADEPNDDRGFANFLCAEDGNAIGNSLHRAG